MRIARILCLIVVLSGPLLAESTEIWPVGRIVPKVECLADSRQSYALYLPTKYRNNQKWPVLFLFEPLARGALPVEIIQKAAENFGFILISSNNSRNGPISPQIDGGNAMWRDVQTRFSIDMKRVYFGGFSGVI